MPYVTANSKELYYTVNNPEGKVKATLIFIHGLGSSSCFYHPVIPNLSSDIRCIALDTCGSGLSKLSGSEQTVETIANDVAGLLDALKVNERVVIVGHSMGGIVASQFASSYPARVKAVVLIGPVNPKPEMSKVFNERITTVQKGGLESLAATVPTAATGVASKSLHHAFIRSLILGTSPEGYVSLCKVIATAEQPKYETIMSPLLIIAGENDKTVPLLDCQTILSMYGTKEEEKSIEVLEGVGHWHCVEDPDKVTLLIQQFMDKVSN